jgi:hypothetical protein
MEMENLNGIGNFIPMELKKRRILTMTGFG